MSKFSKYTHVRYVGALNCEVCGLPGYVDEGRIMGSKVWKINHRISINAGRKTKHFVFKVCYR